MFCLPSSLQLRLQPFLLFRASPRSPKERGRYDTQLLIQSALAMLGLPPSPKAREREGLLLIADAKPIETLIWQSMT